MGFILKDPTNVEIIKAIENNRFEFYKNSYKAYGVLEENNTPDFICYFTGNKSAILNGTIYTEINKIIEDKIDEMIAFFEERNTPFIWHAGSKAIPDSVRDLLIKRDFQVQSQPGMAINLNKIPDINNIIPNFEIVKIRNSEHVKFAAEVFCTANDLSIDIVIDFLEMGLKSLESDNYLGVLNGKAVSTSGVAYASGVAGIYFVSTLEEARRRGIGSITSFRPLFDAKTKGYHWAILHSSEMGFEMYKKMGFEHYSDINQCIWIPKMMD